MGEKNKVGIRFSKEKNFSEWYQEVILKSELADYTAVSGCIAFRPLSYAIWENIKCEIDKSLRKMGVKNVYFPLFIPEKNFDKMKEHVEGFSPEVAWVTEVGNKKLSERLAVRPTSETIMYPSYAKWIRSWKDLPMKYNQWNNVVRWEFKHPVPFLRTREFLWNEGHTVFATRNEAEKEMGDIISLWDDFTRDYLALPSIIGQKSEKEKFAGAEYSWSVEFILPNGKAIQGPDAHFDGQKFAKAFDITFLDKNEKRQYPFQNTWAISTRMIGIMTAIHGDDKGLVIPPKIAPNKGVVIPILFKKDKEKVLRAARNVGKKLKKYNVLLDDREDYSAGWKFNEWELKGVPIRIEIGPKDVSSKKVVLVRRDTGEKNIVGISNVVNEFRKLLDKIQENLYKRAKKDLASRIVNVKSLSELKKVVKNGKIGKASWCGSVKCEEDIKDKTGSKSLNSEFGGKLKKDEKCFACGDESKFVTYFGRSY
ncbi:MAG: proline--tRNA ligase [Nanoarchaeota archaeon]|nr:proline--tRNA ligase [Nanoarchaeota archaeon]